MKNDEPLCPLNPIATIGGGVIGGGIVGGAVSTTAIPTVVVGTLGVTLGAAVLAVPMLVGVGIGAWVASNIANDNKKSQDVESGM